MKAKWAFYLLLSTAAISAIAQTPAVIPLAKEPHHHLAFHNDYVNVYQVEVAPGDSVLLHRHEVDAVSVMTDDAVVTVHMAGKPDAHQKLTGGQVRLQPKGYVHSTAIDPGSKRYRNVTVELLVPQQDDRNLCAQVIAGLPLNCPAAQPSSAAAAHIDEPQFETSQTRVTLTRVRPHQSVTLGSASEQQLLVALDDAELAAAGPGAPGKSLHSGDFVWLEKGAPARALSNSGASEVRFVLFALKSLA